MYSKDYLQFVRKVDFVNFVLFQSKCRCVNNTEFKDELALKVNAELIYDQIVIYANCVRNSNFGEMLFFDVTSHSNPLWNPDYNVVYQDMNQPLSAYWINSSHNTYLSQDQLFGKSDALSYIKCLLMGARCVEIDTWNGANGQPKVTHGNTLTSRISFEEVIKAIKQAAFIKSEYPVILSIENHCSVAQQEVMVKMMRNIFGSSLLLDKVSVDDPLYLPSPEDLKGKILIKGKRLTEFRPITDDFPNDAHQYQNENKLKSYNSLGFNIIHSGRMYIYDSSSRKWLHLFAIMTKEGKLFYLLDIPVTVSCRDMIMNWSLLDAFQEPISSELSEHLPRSVRRSVYFNDRVPMEIAFRWMYKHKYLSDGHFFLSPSTAKKEFDYLLLLVLKDCKIHSYYVKYDGERGFVVIYHSKMGPSSSEIKWIEVKVPDGVRHSTIDELIHYHRIHSLPVSGESGVASINLTMSIPAVYFYQLYYHSFLKHEKSETWLSQMIPGAFLLRRSSDTIYLINMISEPAEMKISYV
ncbi:hypothetical protein Ciccas_001967 [Cichlidogyrus casuarinus]|uniref:Phosphoinositide phospholipase C n=1 Tax=Cichlidogyrus casuarinus TaxID=1844966 RepID=A0ABD2QIJ9_9PLAT